jgi:hypothetical protein
MEPAVIVFEELGSHPDIDKLESCCRLNDNYGLDLSLAGFENGGVGGCGLRVVDGNGEAFLSPATPPPAQRGHPLDSTHGSPWRSSIHAPSARPQRWDLPSFQHARFRVLSSIFWLKGTET